MKPGSMYTFIQLKYKWNCDINHELSKEKILQFFVKKIICSYILKVTWIQTFCNWIHVEVVSQDIEKKYELRKWDYILLPFFWECLI